MNNTGPAFVTVLFCIIMTGCSSATNGKKSATLNASIFGSGCFLSDTLSQTNYSQSLGSCYCGLAQYDFSGSGNTLPGLIGTPSAGQSCYSFCRAQTNLSDCGVVQGKCLAVSCGPLNASNYLDCVCNCDSDCNITAGSSQPFCNSYNICSECRSSSDCRGDKPFCSSWGTCVKCLTDGNCDVGTPHCLRGVCSQCAQNSDCPNDASLCVQGICEAPRFPFGQAFGPVVGGFISKAGPQPGVDLTCFPTKSLKLNGTQCLCVGGDKCSEGYTEADPYLVSANDKNCDDACGKGKIHLTCVSPCEFYATNYTCGPLIGSGITPVGDQVSYYECKCNNNADCNVDGKSPKPICATDGRCVQCVTNNDCLGNSVCSNKVCISL